MNLTQIMLQSKLPIRELTSEESKKLKAVLLEIYTDVATVCNKNNLTCFLSGGSCLGAVRHNGFIPWDDDLDVMMFREDYDKLPSLLEANFPGKYSVVGPGLSEDSSHNFIKIGKLGTAVKTIFDNDDVLPCIAIDVFPIESVPKNALLNRLHGTILNGIFYIAICAKLFQKPSTADKILLSVREGKRKLLLRKLVGFLFSWRSYTNWMLVGNRIASKKYQSDKVTIPSGRGHYFGEMHEKSVFFPSVKHSFEGIEADIPNDYDKYLSALYGDYMQIPPPEKREKHFIVEIDFGK
ncbi:MAG: LicD family protein [Treponema sp.]|nr:LicD family protein [Treponema sp.]